MRHAALHPLGIFAGGRLPRAPWREGKRKAPPAAGREYGVPRAAKNRGDGAWLAAPKRSEGGLFDIANR